MKTRRLRGGAQGWDADPPRRHQSWALLVFLSLRRGSMERHPEFGREGYSSWCWCLWRGARRLGVQSRGEKPYTGVSCCWLEDVPLPGHPPEPEPQSLFSSSFPESLQHPLLLEPNKERWARQNCPQSPVLSIRRRSPEEWVWSWGNDLAPLGSPSHTTFLKQTCSSASCFSKKPEQFLQHLGWERALTSSGPGTGSLNSHLHNSFKSLTQNRKIFMAVNGCVCKDNFKKAVGFLSHTR